MVILEQFELFTALRVLQRLQASSAIYQHCYFFSWKQNLGANNTEKPWMCCNVNQQSPDKPVVRKKHLGPNSVLTPVCCCEREMLSEPLAAGHEYYREKRTLFGNDTQKVELDVLRNQRLLRKRVDRLTLRQQVKVQFGQMQLHNLCGTMHQLKHVHSNSKTAQAIGCSPHLVERTHIARIEEQRMIRWLDLKRLSFDFQLQISCTQSVKYKLKE